MMNSGGVLGFSHIVQQLLQGSGCYAAYRMFEGNHARKEDLCHDQRTCEVCHYFTTLKQQPSKLRPCGAARMLEHAWEGSYVVKLPDELREKEKEMLKTPPKATPDKGKGRDKEKRAETAAQ